MSPTRILLDIWRRTSTWRPVISPGFSMISVWTVEPIPSRRMWSRRRSVPMFISTRPSRLRSWRFGCPKYLSSSGRVDRWIRVHSSACIRLCCRRSRWLYIIITRESSIQVMQSRIVRRSTVAMITRIPSVADVPKWLYTAALRVMTVSITFCSSRSVSWAAHIPRKEFRSSSIEV